MTHAVEPNEPYTLGLVAYDAEGLELGGSECRTETVLGAGQTRQLELFIIDTSGG